MRSKDVSLNELMKISMKMEKQISQQVFLLLAILAKSLYSMMSSYYFISMMKSKDVREYSVWLEMVRYYNRKGACSEKLKRFVSLVKQVYIFLYLYVNSDVTDTLTDQLWFYWIPFLRLLLGFIKTLYLPSFYLSKR